MARNLSTAARLDAIESDMREIRALLTALVPADAPAKKSPRKPARKAAKPAVTEKVATKALPKGVRTTRAAGGTLSTREWNRTLTAKARFAGGDTYRRVLACWDDAQVARANGVTPDEFLSSF